MNNVICECCWVVKGWRRSCNCNGGPTRTDPSNPFGLKEPWINTAMGRNERWDDPAKAPAAATQEPRT